MQFNDQSIRQWSIPAGSQSYTPQDCIRHARGLGIGLPGARASEERQFIAEDGPLVMPTLPVAMGAGIGWMQDPATGIEWSRIVHSEEAVTLHKPLPARGSWNERTRVLDLFDKGAGKGALIYLRRELSDAHDEPLATIDVGLFLRGNGGFGGKTEGAPKPHELPTDRSPDVVVDLPSPRDEDAIYKIPASLAVANAVPGRSALRGVCAFGIAARGVLLLACGGRPERLKHLRLRYMAPIFTGETVRVELWHEGEGSASFRARSIERDVVLMGAGHARFDA